MSESKEKPTSLEELKRLRATSKAAITRVKNLLETDHKLNQIELECRLGIVDSYYKQLSSYQSQIERLQSDDNTRDELDELYIKVKTKLLALINEKREHNVSIADTSFSAHFNGGASRLPSLKLPRFDGNYGEYKQFIHSFENLVNSDQSIPTIEKFNYLVNCLSGEALSTIKAFQITKENYPKALERLKERYDKDALIFLENIATIFSLPKLSKPSSKQLRSIVDSISALYSSLQSLGSHEQICDALIIHIAMSKVDLDTKLKWDDSQDFSKLPSWNTCSKFLDIRCQQFDMHSKPCNRLPTSSTNQHSMQTKHSMLSQQRNQNSFCSICKDSSHRTTTCQRFKNAPIDDRVKTVKDLGLCINCLSTSHESLHCPSKNRCKVCSHSHHSLLHDWANSESLASSSLAATYTTFHQHVPTSISSKVMLATAVILVQDVTGNFVPCRALLDSCSQVNLITENLVKCLNLKKQKSPTDIIGVGSSNLKLHFKTVTIIKSRTSNFEKELDFLISRSITSYHPDETVTKLKFPIPHNIQLADPEFHRRQGIDMLLGAEIFFQLLSVGQIKLGEHLPVLQKTLLGWIVSGKYGVDTSTEIAATCSLAELQTSQIEKSLEKLWCLESVECTKKKFTTEELLCEEHFKATTKTLDDGRLIVSLPFKTAPTCLGESYKGAYRRLLSIERKLNLNSSLKEDYARFMEEYESLGHMSRVEFINNNSPKYFIPHHAVLKPHSSSTKLRVVFDASAKSSSEVSLNDILMVGPTIQNPLLTTLLRFRCHRYGLTADVIKMYRQVLVCPEDRQLQLILWRKSPAHPVSIYALNTVTYGTSSAPYLAIRSLVYAAEKFPKGLNIGRSVIQNDFYVDDMISGADDVESLQLIKSETTEILGSVQFSLSKWHSNCEDLTSTQTDAKDLQIDSEVTSTLGISWQPTKDVFQFHYRPNKTYSRNTKRTILSMSSTLFDPMGLLSPLIIRSKILLQILWTLKCDWDESVPQAIDTTWNQIVADLFKVSQIAVPRFVGMPQSMTLEVHGFADASMKAYGCCIYFRCMDSNGNISVKLLTSKSRVAPIKTKTLPRLELCAAHLLAIFWRKLQPQIKYNVHKTYFWSDSQIVLHWLQSHSSTLSVFVGNRVQEIQEASQLISWRYVPSALNPADLISRGCTTSDLINSIWFGGPTFLYSAPEFWPSNFSCILSEDELSNEKRKMVLSAQIVQLPWLIQQLHKYSSHMRCLRIVAYILRMKLMSKRNGVPTWPELSVSLHRVVWVIQQYYFQQTYIELKNQKPVSGQFATLAPFLDIVDGVELIRVGGRLQNAEIPLNAKHPLLLPKKDPFVCAMVRFLHTSNCHAGPKALVCLVQQKFWVINCRQLARSIVYGCILCKRFKPKLLQQVMGALPKDRISSGRPFQIVGVDFAGPVLTYLRIRGKVPYKTYIAVFVCFTSKAVHLEVVSDLSADAFIACLKRFVGRRGLPQKVYCDNATNFTGAAGKLKQLFQQPQFQHSINSHCASSGIEFCFIPPRAPHFGGLWEAAVKVAKTHLLKAFNSVNFTFEELNTALIEVEAIMNSRPISPMSSDPNDFQALTPGHFIIGCSLREIPERVNMNVDISHIQRWQRISVIKSHFWQRWHKEYLADLQNRYRWKHSSRDICVNDLVIIHEDNVPPLQWMLGRVVKVIRGSDGHVRVADVKTSTTILRRPISKLAIIMEN